LSSSMLNDEVWKSSEVVDVDRQQRAQERGGTRRR